MGAVRLPGLGRVAGVALLRDAVAGVRLVGLLASRLRSASLCGSCASWPLFPLLACSSGFARTPGRVWSCRRGGRIRFRLASRVLSFLPLCLCCDFMGDAWFACVAVSGSVRIARLPVPSTSGAGRGAAMWLACLLAYERASGWVRPAGAACFVHPSGAVVGDVPGACCVWLLLLRFGLIARSSFRPPLPILLSFFSFALPPRCGLSPACRSHMFPRPPGRGTRGLRSRSVAVAGGLVDCGPVCLPVARLCRLCA